MKKNNIQIIHFSSKDSGSCSFATREHLQKNDAKNKGIKSTIIYYDEHFNLSTINNSYVIILHEVRIIKRIPKLILFKLLFFLKKKSFPKLLYDSHDLNKLQRTIDNDSSNNKKKFCSFLKFQIRCIAEFILYYFSDGSIHVSEGHEINQAKLYKLISKKIFNTSEIYYSLQKNQNITIEEESDLKNKFKNINKNNFNKIISSLTYLGSINKRRVDPDEILVIKKNFKIDKFNFHGPRYNFKLWLNASKEFNIEFLNQIKSKSLKIVDKGPFDSRDLQYLREVIECTFIPPLSGLNDIETRSLLNNKMFISLALKVPILYHKNYKNFHKIFSENSINFDNTDYFLLCPSREVDQILNNLKLHNEAIFSSNLLIKKNFRFL